MRQLKYLLAIALLLCSCIVEETLDPIHGRITGATVVTNPTKSIGKKNTSVVGVENLDSLHLFVSDDLTTKIKSVAIGDSGKFVFDSLELLTYDIASFNEQYGVIYKGIVLSGQNPEYHIDALEVKQIFYKALEIDTSAYVNVIYYGKALQQSPSGSFRFPSLVDAKNNVSMVMLEKKNGELEHYYVVEQNDGSIQLVDQEVIEKVDGDEGVEILKIDAIKRSCDVEGKQISMCFAGGLYMTNHEDSRGNEYQLPRDVLYDEIIGFEYNWGTEYTILAKRLSMITNEEKPYDIGTYEIISVLDSQEHQYGELYESTMFDMKSLPLVVTGEDYFIDGYLMECDLDINCEELKYLVGTEYQLGVSFVYLSDSKSRMKFHEFGQIHRLSTDDPRSSPATPERGFEGDSKIKDPGKKLRLNNIAMRVSSYRQKELGSPDDYFPDIDLEYEIYQDLRDIAISDSSAQKLLFDYNYAPGSVDLADWAEYTILLEYNESKISIDDVLRFFEEVRGYLDPGIGFPEGHFDGNAREYMSLDDGELKVRINFTYPVYSDLLNSHLTDDLGINIVSSSWGTSAPWGLDKVETTVNDSNVYYKFIKTGCPTICALERVWEYSLDKDNNASKISESGDSISEILEANN